VGFLAGLVAALSPHLVAHGKVIGHEAVAVFLWSAAVLASLAVHDGMGAAALGSDPAAAAALERRRLRLRLALRLVVVGVLLGLAVFSRFVNGLLGPLVGAILLLRAPAGWRRPTILLGAAILPAVALLVGFALWPRLWPAPLGNLVESWAFLRGVKSEEAFLGTVTTHAPGLIYFPVYLVATAPIGVLLAAALGLGRAAAKWRERAALGPVLVVLLWVLVPLVAGLSPVRRDGVRYILPALVPLALLAGVGIDWLVSRLGQKIGPGRERRLFAGAAAALTLYLVVTCARIHPYYLDYYGEQVGGPAAAARGRLFEIGWWGEGVADAVEYVNQHAAPGARVHRACVRPSHLTWLRGDLWADVRKPTDADWILVYEPWRRCPLPPDARLVHEVAAQGAPLARVYRRGRAAGPAEPGRNPATPGDGK
jgi:4-amino-4-deoxy-L-arabinose transferase-like glycosyltransferase